MMGYKTSSLAEQYITRTGSHATTPSRRGFGEFGDPELLPTLQEQRDTLVVRVSKLQSECSDLSMQIKAAQVRAFGTGQYMPRHHWLKLNAKYESKKEEVRKAQALLAEVGAMLKRAKNRAFSEVFLDVARKRLPQAVFASIWRNVADLQGLGGGE